MSEGAASWRPRALSDGTRVWFLVGSAVLWLVALLPPFSVWSGRYEFVAALRFSVFAIVVPALVTVGAPWRWLGLAARGPSAVGGPGPRPVDRLAGARHRHPELVRTLGFVLIELVAVVLWTTPSAVDAVATDGWTALAEAVTLLVVGVGLWLEMVESPPLAPRSGNLRRAAVGAVVMWAFWVHAYLVGMSSRGWYRNFHHAAGRGLSASADQQVATAVLWFVAAVVFVPVIFLCAMRWLHGEEDPDAELYRLTRTEARRSFGGPPAPG